MTTVEEVLEHHGIKGMHWGVRRTTEQLDVSTSHTPGRRVKTTGGTGQPASEDAVKAAKLRQQAKASTTDSLSNKELQDLVTRMNLEQQYSRLSSKPKSEGRKFVEGQLRQMGQQHIAKLAAKSFVKLGIAAVA